MTKTFHIKAGSACQMRAKAESAPQPWTTRKDLIFQESEVVIQPINSDNPLFQAFTFVRGEYCLTIAPELVEVQKHREGSAIPVQPQAPKPAPIQAPKPQAQAAATIPQDLVDQLHLAMKQLAGVCDGASTLDNQGFSKCDTDFGHALAEAPRLSQKQAAWAATFVIKYQRQIEDESLIERARPFVIARKKKGAA